MIFLNIIKCKTKEKKHKKNIFENLSIIFDTHSYFRTVDVQSQNILIKYSKPRQNIIFWTFVCPETLLLDKNENCLCDESTICPFQIKEKVEIQQKPKRNFVLLTF